MVQIWELQNPKDTSAFTYINTERGMYVYTQSPRKSSAITYELSLAELGKQSGLDYFWSLWYIAQLLAEENPWIKCASDTDSTLQPIGAGMR